MEGTVTKIARWTNAAGEELAGVVDATSLVPHLRISDPREGDLQIIELARAGAPAAAAVGDPVAVDDVRLVAPLRRPPAIRDFYAFEQHVTTSRRARGLEMPAEWYEQPVFYFTSPHTVLGPDDDVAYPDCEELDYELEVAAVIGVEGRDLRGEAALDAIVGFTIFNDFSARDVQRREMTVGLGPSKGKDFASALGPYLVTPDELRGARDRPEAEMIARVNGEEWSRGQLADIHHSFAALVEHSSRDSRVRPGDVIGSGTVGTGCILELSLTHGSDRYPWLTSGDVIELEVEGIGVLRNRIGRRGSRGAS